MHMITFDSPNDTNIKKLFNILDISYEDIEVPFGWCLKINLKNIYVGDIAGINANIFQKQLSLNEIDCKWLLKINNKSKLIPINKLRDKWVIEDELFNSLKELIDNINSRYQIIDIFPINEKLSS